MADQSNLKLVRHIEQVKKLSSDVTLLRSSYYDFIKPFLFGTDNTEPISLENIPGGISQALNNGRLVPGRKVYLKAEGKAASEYKIGNIHDSNFVNDVQSKRAPASEYLFPSDVVRILTALAELFHKGDGKFQYNADALSSYVGKNLYTEWAEVGNFSKYPELETLEKESNLDSKVLFYEATLENNHASQIAQLLEDVKKAAEEYETIYKKLDTSEFELRTEGIQKFLIPDLVPKILEKYEDYTEKIKPLIDQEEKFREAAQKISEKIAELLKQNDRQYFDPLFIPNPNLKSFAEQDIYDADRNAFLFSTRQSDGKLGIIHTDEYEAFTEKLVEQFLSNNKDDITKEFITPLFITEEAPAEAEAETEAEEVGEGTRQDEETQLSTPLSLSDFKSRLLEDVTQRTYQLFVTDYIQATEALRESFNKHQTTFESRYLEPLTTEIQERISQEFIDQFSLSEDDLAILSNQNLVLEESETVPETQLDAAVFESDWYNQLLEKLLEQVSQLASPDTDYASYFAFLSATFVEPVLSQLETAGEPEEEKPEETPAEEPEAPEEPEEPPTEIAPEEPAERISTAAVPTEIPQAPAPVAHTAAPSDEVARLTPEQIRGLQYESAWIYNRAVYELFTVHGIDRSDIDPVLLNKLQADVFNFTAGMDPDSLNMLFGSDSKRQKALLEFYTKFRGDNNRLLADFVSDFTQTDRFRNLSPEQKNGFSLKLNELISLDIKIQSPSDLLNKSLKENLKIDSPVLNQNIQNTVDALIIQYGVNQTFYALDPTSGQIVEYQSGTSHDFNWFIDNVPPERLSLIFNLPQGVVLDQESLILLRHVLKEYAQNRSADLSLHIKNTSLRKGLIGITEEEAEKLKAGDEAAFARHLDFTANFRNAVKENGGETVAGGLEEKRGSNRKEVIQQQYKTFYPLWNQLSGVEQAEVYLKFGIPIPANLLKNGKPDKKQLEVHKLVFIPEFIFFNPAELDLINKIIKDKELTEAQREHFLEIARMQENLSKEEAFAKYLKNSYEYYSDETEIVEITEYLEVGPDESLHDNYSYRDYYGADEAIQAGGSTDYENLSRRGGLISRFSDSRAGRALKDRFGKKLKKKLSPAEKSKKAMGSAISEGFGKVAAAASNLIIPGSGAALLAIRNKKLRNIISGAILGGFAWIIGRTIWALGSIGGAIGGAIGGIVAGVLSGTTLILPGVIVGANIGEAILPARWTDLVWGGKTPPPPKLATQVTAAGGAGAGAAEAAGTATAVTAGGLAAASTAVAAVAGTGFGVFIITLFTIFTIQSAFIIPVPRERYDVAFDPTSLIGGIDLENCDAVGPVPFSKNTSSDIAGRAFDIVNQLRPGFWCYWNWNPMYDGLQADFQSLDFSESPDLFDEIEFTQHPNHCVYRDNFPQGCSGDWNAMGGSALYWCTWLVNHAYQANYSLAARIMADQFRTWPGHIFLPVETITYQDVQPGDVIFTSTEGRLGQIGHVAIVHDVGPDYIRSVDSNASSRYHSFAVGTDGRIQADTIPYLTVVGFGRKL